MLSGGLQTSYDRHRGLLETVSSSNDELIGVDHDDTLSAEPLVD